MVQRTHAVKTPLTPSCWVLLSPQLQRDSWQSSLLGPAEVRKSVSSGGGHSLCLCYSSPSLKNFFLLWSLTLSLGQIHFFMGASQPMSQKGRLTPGPTYITSL